MSSIEKYFNRIANEYDCLPFVLKRAIEKEVRILETLIPNLRTESILDIGCGTGRLTAKLKEIGAEAYGIDIADQMIKIAVSKYPGIFETVDFYAFQSDRKFKNAISIMGGAFGIIESIDSHMVTTKQFFKNLNQLLNLQGSAIIEFLNGSSIIRNVSAADIEKGNFQFLQSLVFDPNGFYEKAYSASELQAIAQEFGFDEIEFYAVSKDGNLSSLKMDSEVGLLKMKKKRELVTAT